MLESKENGRPINVFDGPNDDPESVVKYTGKFHGFCQDVIEMGDGDFKQACCAIVEHPNGMLDVLFVQYCQFVIH